MRLLLLLGLFAAIAVPRSADACSCVERSFAEHAKTEKRVFLARAGKPNKQGDALKQSFTVLATFKGIHETEFLLDRPATPPCAADYREGEIAILFTTGGDLDPCHGNEPLEAQGKHLAEIVDATKVKTTTADPKAVEAGRADALKGYKKPGPKDVKITRSFTIGAVTFVRGTYRREGLRFDLVLLRDKAGAWSVISRNVVET